MAPSRPSLPHSSSYTYGGGGNEQYSHNGMSQERSTASPGQDQSENQQQWHKYQTAQGPHPSNEHSHNGYYPNQHGGPNGQSNMLHPIPQLSGSVSGMLPPLHLPPRQYYHQQPSPGYPPQYYPPPSKSVLQYQYQNSIGTGGQGSHPSNHGPPTNLYTPPPHSQWSPTGAFTPTSAGYNPSMPYQMAQFMGNGVSNGSGSPQTPGSGTIQPHLAFNTWNPDNGRSVRPGTISGALLAGEQDLGRLDDRRGSTGGSSPDQDQIAQERSWGTPLVSPAISEPPSNMGGESGVGVQSSVEQVTYREGQIWFTTDSEVKQTEAVRRMCYNCYSKQPPSWRKSILVPGKILCNKCGIFERTHHRPRPHQNDDGKLRKTTGRGFVREPEPMLQVISDGEHSDITGHPQSPFANDPSKSTPLSMTSPGYSYHQTPGSLTSSRSSPGSNVKSEPGLAIDPQLSNEAHRRVSIPIPPTPTSFTLPNPSSFSYRGSGTGGPAGPVTGGYNHQNNHRHPSPYTHAYANRRVYSTPMRGSVPSPQSSPPLTSENGKCRSGEGEDEKSNSGGEDQGIGGQQSQRDPWANGQKRLGATGPVSA